MSTEVLKVNNGDACKVRYQICVAPQRENEAPCYGARAEVKTVSLRDQTASSTIPPRPLRSNPNMHSFQADTPPLRGASAASSLPLEKFCPRGYIVQYSKNCSTIRCNGSRIAV